MVCVYVRVRLQTGKTSIIKDLHVSEAEYEVARSRLVSWALANPEGTYPSRSKGKKKKKKKHKKKKLSSSSESESSGDSDSSSSHSEPASMNNSRSSVSAFPSASSSSEALRLRLPNASSNFPDFDRLLNRLDRLFQVNLQVYESLNSLLTLLQKQFSTASPAEALDILKSLRKGKVSFSHALSND